MLIVCMDTSGKSGTLALCAGHPTSLRILGQTSLASRMYSAELVPKLDEMLRQQDLAPKDLEAIVVVSGPGSFTGLRVGLSTAKALADVLKIPIAALSLLEVMASMQSEQLVVTALDAQRSEVYVGEYEFRDGTVCHRCESLQSVQDFAVWLKAKDPAPTVLTPDESLISSLRAHFVPVTLIRKPESSAIAFLGLRKLMSGETVSSAELDANYIRRSDAEIFSAPKLGIPQRS